MFSSTRWLFVPACLLACVVVSPAVVARAQLGIARAVAAQATNAPAAEAPATTPAQPVAPPVAAAAAKPVVEYPQVNMAGFGREYRAIPIDATAADVAIRAALRAPMRRLNDFHERPLRDVIDVFGDASGLPVVCDVQALSDAGIDLDGTTVTQALTRMPGVSLAAALRLVLRDVGLTWIVRDEVLTVTTREKAMENLVVVAYPLPRGFGDSRPADFQTMIDLVQSVVAAATWDVVGGPGAIKPLESAGEPLLVVSQTSEIHDEVENLLRRVHERLLAEFTAGRPVLRVHHVADDHARASLSDWLKDLCNTSLRDLGDGAADVTMVGDSVSVLSKSPEFHALAAQTIAAVAGVARSSATP